MLQLFQVGSTVTGVPNKEGVSKKDFHFMLEETKYFQTQTQTLRLRGCDCSLTKLGSGGQDKNP